MSSTAASNPMVSAKGVRPWTAGRVAWLVTRWVVVSLMLIFALFPVVWIASAAFNPTGSMLNQTLIPQGVDNLNDLLVNFNKLFDNPQVPFLRWIFNSLFVAVTTTMITLFIACLAAYSFSRFRFAGRRQLLVGILLIQVFPNILAMVALYLMLLQLKDFIPWLGVDTYGGLILVYSGGAMGVNTMLMKGYFDTIPRDIDESAMVDGASHWQAFWYLIFPLVRPILVVVGVLAFVGTFNEFLLARIMLTDRQNWTLMVGLFNFVSAEFAKDWGVFAAGSLIAATPIVIIYQIFQRYIVGGLTVGAVKG